MDSNVPVTYDEISVSRSSTDVPFPFTLGYTGQYHTHTHTCTHLHTHFILHNDKHSNISICFPVIADGRHVITAVGDDGGKTLAGISIGDEVNATLSFV